MLNFIKDWHGAMSVHYGGREAMWIFCLTRCWAKTLKSSSPMPGVDQEHAGIIRHGSKVLYAYCEATVPKLTVIMRKAYGGGYITMCSRHMKADFVYAWPTAEIAVMGPAGAANIIFRKEIKEAEDPVAMREQKIEEYKDKFANPYVAAGYGYVDAVINPDDTRKYLIQALLMASNKSVDPVSKKHGIPPF